MSKPSTALLIPCYNAERYLENLRKQVDALEPAFDELVIVDDGSTDGTVAKARRLGFDIIPLGRNRGPGAARNAAASRASAEWIHFLDADDEIAPDYLEKVLPVAVDGVDVVLSSTEFVEEDTRKPILRWDYAEEEFCSNALRATIIRPVLLHSSLIRRSSFQATGGFDEEHRCWEDGDVHVRLAASGAHFRAVSDLLARSPRHRRGTSGSDLYCHRCRLGFLEKYTSYIPRVPEADLIKEVVLVATLLHRDADAANADRALDLACSLGWKGPETKSALLAALWKIPSKRVKKALFGLQMAKRGVARSQEASAGKWP